MPSLGGAISGLWLGDIPVLRSTQGSMLATVFKSGCYPLVPFSNRVAHAILKWNDASHRLVQNFPPEPHAIHGVGWQRPWTVREADARFALMSIEHAADVEFRMTSFWAPFGLRPMVLSFHSALPTGPRTLPRWVWAGTLFSSSVRAVESRSLPLGAGRWIRTNCRPTARHHAGLMATAPLSMWTTALTAGTAWCNCVTNCCTHG